MQRQGKDVLCGCSPYEQHPHQRTGPQVERSRRLTAQRLLHMIGRRLHEAYGDIQHLMHDLNALAVVRVEGRAQRLVPRDQAVHRGPECRDVQCAGQAQGGHQVVLDGVRGEVVQEPQAFLRERQRQRAVSGDGHEGCAVRGVVLARGEHSRQTGHRGLVEQHARGEGGAQRGADAGDDLETGDGVAAEVEEVVVDRGPRDAEHLRPDGGQRLLGRGARSDGGCLLVPGRGRGQCLAVQLAVRGQRQFLQHHERGRDHVLRELSGELGADRVHRRPGARLRHEVGHQPLRAGLVLTGGDRRLPDARAAGQRGLDLTEFDAVAAHLDLVVTATGVLQHPVRPPPHHIPRAVQALPRGERVGDEPLGRQRGPSVIAAGHGRPAEVELGPHPHRHRAQPGVQQPHGPAGQRPPDRHHRTGGRLLLVREPARRVHGGLGRTVDVGHPRTGQHLPDPLRQAGGEGLAAHQHVPGRDVQSVLGHHRGERGGHRRDEAAGPALLPLGQLQHVPRHLQRAAGHQRAEELEHRHVKVQRGGEEHSREHVLTQRQRPVQQRGQRRMGDHHALGAACRPGGVNGVRRRLQGRFLERRRLHGLRRECVDPQQVHVLHHRHAVGQRRLGQDDAHSGVGHHERQPLRRVLRVQRYVGAAGPQYGQDRHHPIRRPGHTHAHPRLHPDTGTPQHARQPLHPLAQLAVGQRHIPAHHRHRIRARHDPFPEQFHDRVPWCRALPHRRGLQPTQLLLRHQRQHTQRCVRMVGERGEQVLEVGRDALGRAGVEQVRVVTEVEAHPVTRVRGQGQRVVGRFGDVDVAEGDAVLLGGACADGIVLEDQQAVEEGGAGGQVRLDVAERDVLVLTRLRLSLLEAAQPLGDGPVPVHVHPHGQAVDEQAQNVLGAGQVVRAAGHGGSEDDITGAAVVRQQQGPRPLHNRVDGDPVGAGEVVDPAGQIVRGDARDVRRRLAQMRLVRDPVVGQAQRLREPRHPCAPEVHGRGVITLGEPFEVRAERAPRPRAGRRTPTAHRRVLGQHVGQQRRRAPAVQQQVVEGPYDVHAPRGQPDERQPHQRRRLQVDALCAVRRQQLPERVLLFPGAAVAPVQHAHRHQRPAVHHLDGLTYALPGHGDPQAVGPVDDALPGPRQGAGVVRAVHGEGELLAVGGGGGFGQSVEDHAGLQRGERVDALHGGAVTGQPVHFSLVEADQGEVRGGAAAGAVLRAVPQESGQLGHHRVGEPPDGLRAVQSPRVRPAEGHTAVLDAAHDIEDVGALFGEAVLAAGVQPCPAVPAVLAADPVELPQVVETHLGARRLAHALRDGGVPAQVVQRAVADSAVGYCPQLLLHRLHRRRPVAVLGQPQGDRVHGGEPSDGAGEVDVVEELLATVPLQMHRRALPPGPATQGAREGGQEDVVHLGAVHPRHVVQERLRLFGAERDRHRVLGRHGVVPAGRVERHGGGRAGRRLAPVRRLLREAAVLDVPVEPLRPLPHRSGLATQVAGGARAQLLVGVGEVLQQDAPGHAVHHQVVRHDQQPYGALRTGVPGQDAHERASLQVEPGLGPRGQLAPVRLGVRRCGQGVHGEDRVEVELGQDAPRPAVLGAGEDAAQRVVPGKDRGHGRAQQLRPGSGGELALHGHVEVRRCDGVGGEVPLADRGGRHRPGHSALLGRRGGGPGRVGLARDGGEAGDRLPQEHVTGGDPQPRPAGPRHDLDAQDRVPAQREEVVVDADPRQAEHLGPDVTEDLLGPRPRRHVSVVAAGRGCGQRPAVDLPAGVDGQLRERDERRGHHVVGQLGHREAAQLVPGRDLPARARYEIGDDLLDAGAVLPYHDRGPLDRVVPTQNGLDLSRLDAQPPDLHLVVAAADELQLPFRASAHHVARAVQPLPCAEGVGDEPLRRQATASLVAAGEPGARDVQLPGDSGRHGTQQVVEDVHAGSAGGTPDRRSHPAARGKPAAHGRDDGHLRGAIGVHHRAPARPAVHQGGVARLPSGQQHAQVRHVRGGNAAEHGRRYQRVRDGRRAQHAQQIVPDKRALDRGDDQGAAPAEGHQQFQHGRVETRRRQLEYARGAVHGAAPHQGGDEGRQPSVRYNDALGPPGRPGGVDDVRGGGQRHVDAGIRRGLPRRLGDDVRVVHDDGSRAAQGETGHQVPARQHHTRAAVAQYVRQPLLGQGGVDGHVHATRLDHGQHRDHPVDRTRQDDRHA
ncbi:hypothetical protein SNL152K_10644 [Streptomyces sp. NL15-2K]|nr:hypothetical protein SNL152K_10644 [Streptomyces sp. NL15-2K]